MPLPLVSRARLQREIAALERLLALAEERQAEWSRIAADASAEADQAKRLYELERRRYDELLTQFMAMKVKGAEVVPVVGGIVEPAPSPSPEKPEIATLRALIAAKCGPDTRRRALMLKQLAVDLAAGRPFEDIEADIEHGVESDGVPA